MAWQPPASGANFKPEEQQQTKTFQAATGAFVPFAVGNTDQLSNSDGIKVLVYGGAGRGKTFLARTAPKPFVLSAEKGLLSLRGWGIPYTEVNSYASLENAYQGFAQGFDNYAYSTIYLDSVSEIAEVILANEKALNTNKQRAYGDMADQVLELFRKFRDIPRRNVVFTAKMGKVKDGQTGALMFGPMLPGQQLDQHVPYMFDEVFQMNTGMDTTTNTPWWALRTQPDFQNEAKDRSGKLAAWEPADLTHVFNKIMA